MTHNRQSGCFAILIAAVALASSCTSDDGGTTGDANEAAVTGSTSPAQQAPQPTLTAPSLQPPPQKQNGRPEVVYDACTWLPDDVVARAGFDPNSRERHGDQIAEVTFLDCRFSSKPRFLTVSSTNATWDEDLQKNSAWNEPININGREAMWVHDPNISRGCDIHLRTKAGFVDLGTTTTLKGVTQGTQPCDGLLDIANTIEPTIGKDN